MTVSDDENTDLWWAMRGAGHNFGIVTSAKLKIYDIQHRDWAYEMFIYTGDKVEALYQSIGEQFGGNDTQPVEILHLSVFLNNPDIDPTSVRPRNFSLDLLRERAHGYRRTDITCSLSSRFIYSEKGPLQWIRCIPLDSTILGLSLQLQVLEVTRTCRPGLVNITRGRLAKGRGLSTYGSPLISTLTIPQPSEKPTTFSPLGRENFQH